MLLQIFITCQPVNLTHDKKCIPIHYRLSFQLFINSPPRWTRLAVLQKMLKLLPRSTGWTSVNLFLNLLDSIEITSVEGLTLWSPEINQSKRPLAW